MKKILRLATYSFFMIFAMAIPYLLFAMLFGDTDKFIYKIPSHELCVELQNTVALTTIIVSLVCSYNLFRRPFKIAIKRIGKFFKFTWIIFLLIGIYLYSLVANSDLDTIWKNSWNTMWFPVALTLIVWYFFIPILYTKKVAEYYSATFPDKFLRFLLVLPLIIEIFIELSTPSIKDLHGSTFLAAVAGYSFIILPVFIMTKITLAVFINLPEYVIKE